MRRRAFLGLPLALAAAGAQADGYPEVVAGRALKFPRDHGSHPDYRTEWWYVTGSLGERGGRELGMQITFFRNRPNVAEASESAFAPRQLVFAHAAVADPSHGRLRHDQRAARAVFGLAGTLEATTRAWIDDWSLALDGDRYRCTIAARGFTLALSFTPTQPLQLQGDAGYSRKGPSPEHASYYYSRPQLAAAGRVDVDGRAREVEGRAWLDHEWSSAYLAPGAVGWDWIGINLDDGGALMAFRIRDAKGEAVWAGGSRRGTTGVDERFAPSQVRFSPRRTWVSPRTSIAYPVEFDMHAGGEDYAIVPIMDDQELDSRVTVGTVYWEGAVRVTQRGRVVGRGYLELTGYGGRLNI